MKDNMKKLSNNKFLAYVRVSSKDQATNWSPEIQKKQIELYAKQRGLEIVDFFEGVESSFRPGRKLFGMLIQRLKKEKLAGICFATVDRSSRNYQDIGNFYKLIEQGYHFHFAAENLTTQSDDDLSRIYDLWGQATVYSQRLRVKVNTAFDRMLEQGLFPSRAPIGYLDSKKGFKEPDPVQSRLVKQAFEMFATGLYGIIPLQDKLKEMGLRNNDGGLVKHKTLYKMFRNPFYYGIVRWTNKGDFKGIHQPIITKSLFDKVQEVLDKKSFKHKRKRLYVFQGMLNCPTCDRPLRCISSTKVHRNVYYKYYNCRSAEHKYNLLEELVDEQFFEELKGIEFSDEEVVMFLKAIGQLREDLKSQQGELTAKWIFEIHKVEKQLDDIMDRFLDKSISSEDYQSMKSKLLNKKIEYTEQLNGVQSENAESMLKMENLGKLLKSPTIAYKTASEESRRRLVKSLVENFSLSDKNVITNWKKECLPISKRDKMLGGSATENRTPI